jgi:hypothetical protein
MIKANHKNWAHMVFNLYLNRLFKRNFHGFHLYGEDPVAERKYPLLLIPNHSSWWDGFFVYYINQQLMQRKLYLMMLESELSKYPFFSRLGAYSISPGEPKKVIGSLKYSLDVMNENGQSAPAICVFPQGEIQPWGKRPCGFESGIKWLMTNYTGNFNLVLMVIKIAYLEEQKPQVFFLFDVNRVFNSSEIPTVEYLENNMDQLLNDIEEKINSGDTGKVIFRGSKSINRRLDVIFGHK